MTEPGIRLGSGQIAGDRSYQEDDYGVAEVAAPEGEKECHVLLVLADGMGGHVGGAEASAIVVTAFIEGYRHGTAPLPERLRGALASTNEALRERIRAQPELTGMGSTLVAASVTENGLWWLSVGDSPCWLLTDGELRRLNADHSLTPMLEELVRAGHLTVQEAREDQRRHILLSAVTGVETKLVDLPATPLPLSPGDILLLASDGLETLEDGEIAAVLSEKDMAALPAQALANALLRAVREKHHPHQDNTTVLVYKTDRAHGGHAPQ